MTQINWMNRYTLHTMHSPNLHQLTIISSDTLSNCHQINVKINTLCNDSGISVTDIHEFIESIRPKLIDRNI